MELAIATTPPSIPATPDMTLALQSVTGSPHRRLQRSRTLPIMQLSKEVASSNFPTSNYQLVRVNTMHIHKQQTKGTKAQNRDWLPAPENLPAGHPLLSRSIERWYRDDESPSRFGSKQSLSPISRNGSKAAVSRIGSKATVISKAGSNAITSALSMRDIASREQMRRRIQTPQLPKPMQQRSRELEAGSPQQGENKHKGNGSIVHALRDAVDAHESSGVTKKWLGQGGSMPSSIRQLDYWSAIEAFELYDFKRLGYLDKPAFYTMLRGLTRKRDYMDEKLSDRIFDEIDINESGGIDKEEFLGWVFETNNFRLNHLREKLDTMSEEEVKKIFRKIDKTGDGQLDKEEFWHFIESIGGIPLAASGDLHEFIDSDNSGQISFDEFLNWVHPDRELEMLEKTHGDWKSDLVSLSDYQRPEKPLMETRPGKPVVIELWIGPDYKFMADRMKLMLCQMFSPEQVHWEFKMDGRISGTCSLVLAKVGRGIELWNRDTMMAYRDDPFLDSSGATARKWLTAVLHKCLPDVERASNLHRLKQRRHMERQGSKSRQGSKQKH